MSVVVSIGERKATKKLESTGGDRDQELRLAISRAAPYGDWAKWNVGRRIFRRGVDFRLIVSGYGQPNR